MYKNTETLKKTQNLTKNLIHLFIHKICSLYLKKTEKHNKKWGKGKRKQQFWSRKITSSTFALSTEQSFPRRFRAVSNATRAMRSIWKNQFTWDNRNPLYKILAGRITKRERTLNNLSIVQSQLSYFSLKNRTIESTTATNKRIYKTQVNPSVKLFIWLYILLSSQLKRRFLNSFYLIILWKALFMTIDYTEIVKLVSLAKCKSHTMTINLELRSIFFPTIQNLVYIKECNELNRSCMISV